LLQSTTRSILQSNTGRGKTELSVRRPFKTSLDYAVAVVAILILRFGSLEGCESFLLF
jgi:hypothetical protein